MDKIHLLTLKNHSIHNQLLLEEALLRTTDKNWCILNEGSPKSIVMGISGKPHELVNLDKLKTAPVPLLKRYSGGGTVIVDSNTLFVSFIFQKEVHSFPCYPEPILRWSEAFYQEALSIPTFHLKENDYVIGDRKCAGNAQYIKKNRFVHHTTFLWDFTEESMHYLLYPPKTPQYRSERSHQDFLCRLNEHLPTTETFFSGVQTALQNRYFVETVTLDAISPTLNRDHRKTTAQIDTNLI